MWRFNYVDLVMVAVILKIVSHVIGLIVLES